MPRGGTGVANVKWLTRIEVIDHRYAGRFMARDYVTIREEQKNGETVWTFMTVSHDRLKSAPAKVTRRGSRYAVMGAAWGAPIAAVQVRIDNGPWRAATLYGLSGRRKHSSGYAWRFWTFDWGTPAPGRTSDHFARVRHGRQHPAGAERSISREPDYVLGEQRARHTSRVD